VYRPHPRAAHAHHLGKIVNFHSIFAFANSCGSFFIALLFHRTILGIKKKISFFEQQKNIDIKGNQSYRGLMVN
jgi:hypothetical protein